MASRDWEEFNAKLLLVTTSLAATAMLVAELEGRNRPQYVKRLHQRLNILRRREEAAQLGIPYTATVRRKRRKA